MGIDPIIAPNASNDPTQAPSSAVNGSSKHVEFGEERYGSAGEVQPNAVPIPNAPRVAKTNHWFYFKSI